MNLEKNEKDELVKGMKAAMKEKINIETDRN